MRNVSGQSVAIMPVPIPFQSLSNPFLFHSCRFVLFVANICIPRPSWHQSCLSQSLSCLSQSLSCLSQSLSNPFLFHSCRFVLFVANHLHPPAFLAPIMPVQSLSNPFLFLSCRFVLFVANHLHPPAFLAPIMPVPIPFCSIRADSCYSWQVSACHRRQEVGKAF